MPRSTLDYTDQFPSPHCRLAFEPSLYNQEDFLRLKDYEVCSFYAVDYQHLTIVARIHVTLRKQQKGRLQAISLPELPFGSLEHDPRMTKEQIIDFLNFVQKKLSRQEVGSLLIQHYADPYVQSSLNLPDQGLAVGSFAEVASHINHHIPVDHQPLSNKMSNGQRGKLKKGQKSGFRCVPEPIETLAEIYDFIESNYQARHRSLSLPLPNLQKYASTFPHHYLLFSVYHQQTRIAACIAVRVKKSILYTFYYTALPTYNSYSPTVFLLSSIYQYCQENQIGVLDLGISTTESLRNFKRRMGGILSYKKTYLLKW